MRLIGLMLTTMIMGACVNDATEIGSDFFNEGVLDLAMVDSSTIKLSTVQFESLATNNESRILLGSHVDEKLGRISATAFFQPGLSAVVNFKDKPFEYSHVTLALTYDEYSYYDTTQVLKLKAHRVVAEIELDDGILYNVDTFSIDREPLGAISILTRPHRNDSLEIPLDDEFGQALFAKAMTADNDLESNTEFVKYIRGFAIVPDTTISGPLIGFSPTTELRVYYIDKSVVPAVTTFVSFKANSGYSFTHFSADRDHTLLANLPDFEEHLDASLTESEAYIQGGCGLALRVDLPHLKTFTQNENFYVTRAILEFFPVRKSYDAPTAIPDALTGYVVNGRNVVISETIYTPVLVRDVDLGRNTYYTLDVTSFVKSQMSVEGFNENGLLFVPYGDDFSVRGDRIYFASRNSEYNTRLKIYYATINE